MPRGRKGFEFTKKEVLEGIERCNGTYASLGRILGIAYAPAAKRWVDRWVETKTKFQEKQQHLVDSAEDVLYANLRSENDLVRQRAAEFALRHMPGSAWREEKEAGTEDKLVDILAKMIDNTDPNKK